MNFGKIIDFAITAIDTYNKVNDSVKGVQRIFNENNIYTWNYFRTKITLPFDMDVATNEPMFFSASSSDVAINIYFTENRSQNIETEALSFANQISWESFNRRLDIQLAGIYGHLIEGNHGGYRQIAAALVNTSTNCLFYVVIVFPNGLPVAQETAYQVFNSLCSF